MMRLAGWRSHASVACAALAAAACGGRGGAAPSEPVTLSGQVTYRERMALPPNAVAVIELTETRAGDDTVRTIAAQRIAPAGPVPIRFTLHYDAAAIDAAAHYYELRGRVEDGAGLVLYTTPVVLIADPLRGARVEVLLERVARGIADDGGAEDERAGAAWARARAAGVEVRAVGQAPGWTLEIAEGDPIVLVTEAGQRREAFLHVQRARTPTGATTYQARNGERRIEVVVIPFGCTDAASGERFDLTVTIRIEGRTLHGCGRRLSDAK